ncbi:MAG: type I-C CRISPR-associated protein Cas5c [Polyangiales bacterium]
MQEEQRKPSQFGIRLRVFGPWACFTRPELKVERVSYEVMTPSAARGILEAIVWKPAIRWCIDAIEVHAPISFCQIKRNEVGARANTPSAKQLAGKLAYPRLEADHCRQQRNSMVLQNVDYVIRAHFRMTSRAGKDDTPAKFAAMFDRRVAKGQCFHRPYLGCREFACHFEMERAQRRPQNITKELGLMLHDIDFTPNGNQPHFFSATLEQGVVHVPPFSPGAVAKNSSDAAVAR